MKIVVTQAHINAGAQQQCYRCPVALAIKDVVPKDFQVVVTPQQALVGGFMFLLPRSARAFIEVFDEHRGGEPFEFDLPLERQFPELAEGFGDPRCGVVQHACHQVHNGRGGFIHVP